MTEKLIQSIDDKVSVICVFVIFITFFLVGTLWVMVARVEKIDGRINQIQQLEWINNDEQSRIRILLEKHRDRSEDHSSAPNPDTLIDDDGTR